MRQHILEAIKAYGHDLSEFLILEKVDKYLQILYEKGFTQSILIIPIEDKYHVILDNSDYPHVYKGLEGILASVTDWCSRLGSEDNELKKIVNRVQLNKSQSEFDLFLNSINLNSENKGILSDLFKSRKSHDGMSPDQWVDFLIKVGGILSTLEKLKI